MCVQLPAASVSHNKKTNYYMHCYIEWLQNIINAIFNTAYDLYPLGNALIILSLFTDEKEYM